MMKEDQSITLMNLMYVIAAICQQGCRHMAATTQIKKFKPNKRGSMTVKEMSYWVLR